MLLKYWYELSDPEQETHSKTNLHFMNFCDFGPVEDKPDYSIIVVGGNISCFFMQEMWKNVIL